MNTEVLKEPRGFMRCLQCFFAMVAFAACANWSLSNSWTVECVSSTIGPFKSANTFSYPFRLDHDSSVVRVSCLPSNQSLPAACKSKTDSPSSNFTIVRQPGDFKSDAEFFVFTGVVAFLASIGSIVVYVFFSGLYMGEEKKFPFYDFCLTVMIAVFWLSASAAWANGISGLKLVGDPDNWLMDMPICKEGTQAQCGVRNCFVEDRGHYGGANASVVFGFLNFFLWASNLWFVYKETHWFSSRSSGPQQMVNNQA